MFTMYKYYLSGNIFNWIYLIFNDMDQYYNTLQSPIRQIPIFMTTYFKRLYNK